MVRSSKSAKSLVNMVSGMVPKVAFAAMAILPLAAAGGAEANTPVSGTLQYYFFQVQNNTGSAQSAFNIQLSGDATTGLGSYGNPYSNAVTSSSYSPSTNATTLTFSSNVTPLSTIASGASAGFGFVNSAEQVQETFPLGGVVTNAYWGASASAYAVPVANMYENNSLASSPIHIADPYAVWIIDVAFASDTSQVTTEYYQTAYTTTPPYLNVANTSGSTEIISNAGYYAPSTLTSALTLDQILALPPTDFTTPESVDTLNSTPTYTLDSGSSLEFVGYPAIVVPEAATLATFGVGAVALLFLPRRRLV